MIFIKPKKDEFGQINPKYSEYPCFVIFLDTRCDFYFVISGLYHGSNKKTINALERELITISSDLWKHGYTWTVKRLLQQYSENGWIIFRKYCKNIPKIFSEPGAWWPGGATAASWWDPRSSASRFMIFTINKIITRFTIFTINKIIIITRFMIITILKQDYNIHQIFYLYNIKIK